MLIETHFQIHMVHFPGTIRLRVRRSARRIDETRGMNCQFFMTTTFRRPHSLSCDDDVFHTASSRFASQPRHRARTLPSTVSTRFIYCSAMDLLYTFSPFPTLIARIKSLYAGEKFFPVFFSPPFFINQCEKLFL